MAPVYTYELVTGESGSLYASNIFEAEDEVWAIHEDHPLEMKEVVHG